jgi:outer membrane protein OmpA-like peptidoglycan-associated protein
VIKVVLTVIALAAASMAFAVERATIPTADRKGSKDNSLLKRYEGSFIVAYDQKAFAEFILPLSRLEEVPGKKDHKNVRAYEPKQKKALEGAYTRLVYVIPANRSPLEVLRNYQEEIRSKGGKILYECKAEECGGKPQGGSDGWAGHMTLARFLYPDDRVTDPFGSNGWCAMMEDVADLRYTAAELPAEGAHVSVFTYTLKVGSNRYCEALNERTIAIVDIVEAKEREQKMVTVQASEMAKSIAGTGRIALYGIYFAFNKADVKPDSDPALEQIAKLLKESSALKLLVVGHTDNVGSFSFNMDLSQRRAAAVVTALATRYGVSKDRLTPVGVSFASPVASNKTEDGRAKNRRVELVEN